MTSYVWFFVIPWTVDQPLKWLAIPSLGDLPDPGVKPMSPALTGVFFPLSHLGSPGVPLEGGGNAIFLSTWVRRWTVVKPSWDDLKRSWEEPKNNVHMLSCDWLCNTMGYSPPGSSAHGILQARILECVAKPSSRGSSSKSYAKWILLSPFCKNSA